MKKALIWAIIFALVSTTVLAAELEDTKIDFTDYREIVPGEAGVIYKIKITNEGDDTRTYEVIPDTNAIKPVGTYRIDPDYRVAVKPGRSETLYFYLTLERPVSGRLSIPVTIASDGDEIQVELAARSVGPFTGANGGFFPMLLRLASFALIAFIIIAFIIALFRKGKKKAKGKDDDAEVETYY